MIAPTQELGSVVYSMGNIEALKVPSAKVLNAYNLIIFPDRVSGTSAVRVKIGYIEYPILTNHDTLFTMCVFYKMLVYSAKLKGTETQYRTLDEMLRTGLFIRNKALRYWMDNPGVNGMDLNKYCKVLADNPEFPWVKKLNSMARQSMAERAWLAISRFFDNCKKKVPGKKGYPKFKRSQTRASVEYKTCGWKLSSDRKYITFTDKFGAGTFKLWGSRDLHFY